MKKFSKGIFVLLIAALIGGCSCNNKNPDPIINEQENTEKVEVNSDISNLYEKNVKSTVVVATRNNIGTGVVYKEEGNLAYILTNAHVLTDKSGNLFYNDMLDVIFSNYTRVRATFVALDKNEDVGVITVRKSDDYTVADIISDDVSMEVGDFVYAIGHPYSNYFSANSGIISDTKVKTSLDYISNNPATTTYVYNTTATINPGNSGGPLFNGKGEVIAINSATPNEELANSPRNFNYAIPINYFIKVADYIVANHTSYKRPSLSLTVKSLIDYQASELEGFNIRKGVHVTVSNEAGISSGRIITEVNGRAVSTVEDYEYELLRYSSQDKIELTIVDRYGGNTTRVTVTLR